MKLCIVFIKCESCHKRIIVEIDKGKINKYKRVFRNMQVYYIYGSAGCGKTSYVFNKHGYDDVYRTTNYEFGWVDDYNGEKVLFLDEFRSSFKISEILDYLDGQPIRIRGRHYNRVACYDTVYIVSNLEDLYVEINSLNFMELSPELRFYKIKDIFGVYSELLSYEPIKDFISEIKKHRPPMEAEISSAVLKYIRNVLVHFPFFKSYFNK